MSDEDYKTRKSMANKGELKKLNKEIRDFYKATGKWRDTVSKFRISPTDLSALVGDIIEAKKKEEAALKQAKADDRANKRAEKEAVKAKKKELREKKKADKKTAKKKAPKKKAPKKKAPKKKAPKKTAKKKTTKRKASKKKTAIPVKAKGRATTQQLVAFLMKNRGRTADEMIVDLLK